MISQISHYTLLIDLLQNVWFLLFVSFSSFMPQGPYCSISVFLLFTCSQGNCHKFSLKLVLTISPSLHCLGKLRPTGPLMFLPARLRYCNETVLHCLSTKCLAWRNTILIPTEACLLPMVSKLPVLFVSQGSCRHSLTAFMPINYLAPVAFRELLRNYDEECNQETGNVHF